MLLTRGAKIEARGGKLDATPLHWAAARGAIRAAVVLLRHGALLQAKDIEGNTALHIAAGRNHAALTAILTARAGVNEEDSKGLTPLMVACLRAPGPQTTQVWALY